MDEEEENTLRSREAVFNVIIKEKKEHQPDRTENVLDIQDSQRNRLFTREEVKPPRNFNDILKDKGMRVQ